MSEKICLGHQQLVTIVTAILASSSKDARTVIAHFNSISKQLAQSAEDDDTIHFETQF